LTPFYYTNPAKRTLSDFSASYRENIWWGLRRGSRGGGGRKRNKLSHKIMVYG